MCLVIKPLSDLNRAKEDIICYKLVKADVSGGTVTLFQATSISENVINGKNPFIAKDDVGNKLTEEAFEKVIRYPNRIDGCAIHTFASKNAAKTEVKEQRSLFGFDNIRVYKCIIPKGTPYYEGFYSRRKSFASQKIVFKEKA